MREREEIKRYFPGIAFPAIRRGSRRRITPGRRSTSLLWLTRFFRIVRNVLKSFLFFFFCFGTLSHSHGVFYCYLLKAKILRKQYSSYVDLIQFVFSAWDQGRV